MGGGHSWIPSVMCLLGSVIRNLILQIPEQQPHCSGLLTVQGEYRADTQD
jgi:hypothetical protein